MIILNHAAVCGLKNKPNDDVQHIGPVGRKEDDDKATRDHDNAGQLHAFKGGLIILNINGCEKKKDVKAKVKVSFLKVWHLHKLAQPR